ncbi:hypothetical protein SAMN04487943_11272 [Gracilibacillus orientalis]|uniref:Uncharacterized protein n=1 Tax=Gracilibacillus orientalis TaxID=334253 RepID=A0A1I4PPJ3_9BACI|nr:hypothetical protein [Gracilibacillus orientalis]SFM29410.1 hypothetical protein SAMN04487943_11272 [Gracilibacillus orientalis]
MKGVYIVSITAVVMWMFIYQWPKIESTKVKEKIAFATLTIIGWVVSIIYIIFPNATSPAKIVDFILIQLKNIILALF